MAEATGYHAHVYFDAATRPVAERLRETIISRFAVKPGGFSDNERRDSVARRQMESRVD